MTIIKFKNGKMKTLEENEIEMLNMNIERMFEDLENMTINNEYVCEKVTDLKNLVMDTISTILNIDCTKIGDKK